MSEASPSRMYRALLLLYPARFRRRYRRQLLDAFRLERGAPRYRGPVLGAARFWIDVLADLAMSLPRCWARELRVRERKHPERKAGVMDPLVGETIKTLRGLRRRPGFAATAALTLALGLGLTIAMFAIVDGVLLRPLPYPEPSRLVRIWDRHEQAPYFSVSVGNFFTWKREARAFEALGAYREDGLNVRVGGEAERIEGARVTAGLLPVLGVEPVLGRFFLEEEDRPGAPPVAILTHGLWQRAFGGRPDVLGRRLILSGAPATIVGVLPAAFRFPQHPQVQLLVPYALDEAAGGRSAHFLRVLGRVRRGTSLEEAQTELETLAERLARDHPETNAEWTAASLPLHQAVTGEVETPLRMLMAAVALVLLVCCANVANLVIAQTTERDQELRLRSALGASRGRLVSQLVTEALLLSSLGAALGFALARTLLVLLPRWLPASIPRQLDVSLDARMVAFAAGLAILTTGLAGLAPAMRTTATRALAGSLRGRGDAGGRLPSLLIVSEVALAVTLLAASGLLLRSYAELSRTDLGFDPGGVLAFDVSPVPATYPEPSDRVRLYRTVIERIEALTEVSSAAVVHRLPLGGNSGFGAHVEGRPVEAQQAPSFNYRSVSSGYFDVLRMPLLQGRGFNEDESWTSGGVAIVNRALARALWPSGGALGARIGPSPEGPWAEVIGIVSDARESSVDVEPEGAMYLPHVQAPVPGMTVVVRSAAPLQSLIPRVRAVLREVDARQPVSNFRTLDEHVSRELGAPRFRTLLLGLFALASLGLAAVGIHGVVSTAVKRRTREIGIRIALGAGTGDVLRTVLRRGLSPVLAGLALGTLGALAAARALGGMVYGVSPVDPLSFSAATALLFSVGLVANLQPALRAANIDPTETIRQ